MVGLAAFARSAPMMVLGPFTGIVADRMHRGRVLVFTQSLGLATGLALAAVFAAGPRRLLAAGRARGALRRALGARLPGAAHRALRARGPAPRGHRGVARDRLDAGRQDDRAGAGRRRPRARRPRAVLRRGGRCSTRSGCSSSSACPRASAGPSGRDTASVAASLGAGFREAWREPTVRAVLMITVLMNVLFFPYQHMLPVFAREVLRVGPGVAGRAGRGRRARRAAGRARHRLAPRLPAARAALRAVGAGGAVPAAGLHRPALALGLPAPCWW